MPLDSSQLAELRTRLVHSRNRVVATANSEDSEAAGLRTEGTGRSSEYEETAQKSSAETTLHRLSSNQRREAEQIDAALARMQAGQYGTCDECGEEIPYDRLAALPFTTLDADCATRLERERTPQKSMMESTKL